MAREQQQVFNWIDSLLEQETSPFVFDDGHKTKIVQQTSNGGFFRLVLRSEAGEDEVELVFSLRDLYLMGFLQGNIWYLFSDSRLDGSGHDEPEHLHEWTYLKFRGNHTDDRIMEVQIGVNGLLDTVDTLLNHHNRSDFRVSVAISEAKRFHEWLLVLLDIFSTGDSHPVGEVFGKLFRMWSSISSKVLDGPDKFEPVPGFDTYGDAVSALDVLLIKQKRKKPKKVEAEFFNPACQFDSDYDIIQESEEEEVVVEEEEDEEE
jgi:hypothetical protein